MLHSVGRGTLGPVFRAFDPARDRIVAIKAFTFALQPEDVVRVADALRELAARPPCHPAAVALVDAGIEGTTPFLVMTWQGGETMDVMLRRVGPATLESALAVLAPVAAVIDAARDAGLEHGALHPRDIFIMQAPDAPTETPDAIGPRPSGGSPLDVTVSGIGVAAALRRAGVSLAPRRAYRAAADRADSTGASDDLYAFGVIAHEILTGRRPLGSGDQDGALAASLPPQTRVHVRRILSRVLAPRPGESFDSASAFVEALGDTPRAGVNVPRADASLALNESADASAEVASRVVPVQPDDAERRNDAPATAAPTGVEPAADLFPAEANPVWLAGAPLDAGNVRVDPDRFPNRFNDAWLTPAGLPQAGIPLASQAADVDAAGSSARVWVGVLVVAVGMLIGGLASYAWIQHRHAPPAGTMAAAATSAPGPAPTDMDVHVPAGRASTPPASPVAAPASNVNVNDASASDSADASAPSAPRGGAAAANRASRASETTSAAVRPDAARANAGSPSSSTSARSARAGAAAVARDSGAATPAAAPTPAGVLIVTSEPSGAMVTVDGRLSGETPVTSRDLEWGAHAVLVARPGHVPYREVVTLSERAPVRVLRVTLTPGVSLVSRPSGRSSMSDDGPLAAGMIDVDSRPRGARVSVDGEIAGPSPLRLPELAPGAHTVTLELGGYKDVSRRVGVETGKVSTLSVTLEPLVR